MTIHYCLLLLIFLTPYITVYYYLLPSILPILVILSITPILPITAYYYPLLSITVFTA